MNTRCVAVGYLSGTELLTALRRRYGIPETAVYIGCFSENGRVKIAVADDGFAPVVVGAECPELPEMTNG